MIDDKPFNMSQLWLESISEVRKKITEARVIKQFETWYRLCCDYWDYCAFIYSAEENEMVEGKLQEIKRMINVPKNVQGQKLAELQIPVIEEKLSFVTRLLTTYLDKHERIFVKGFGTWQDEIKSEFK